MKEIMIKIPTKPEFKRWWEIIKFKLNGGFSCSQCNTKMFFDDVHITSKIKGDRFLFQDHSWKKPLKCPACIQKEIDENVDKIFTELHDCDWCGEKKPTVTFFNMHDHNDINTSFTFGKNHWNGHYICAECMHEGLEGGLENMTSSVYSWDNKDKKTYPQNRLGLLKK